MSLDRGKRIERERNTVKKGEQIEAECTFLHHTHTTHRRHKFFDFLTGPNARVGPLCSCSNAICVWFECILKINSQRAVEAVEVVKWP